MHGALSITRNNEWYGLFTLDIPNLGSRLNGSTPWAFELQDFRNNNTGVQLWIGYNFWKTGITDDF